MILQEFYAKYSEVFRDKEQEGQEQRAKDWAMIVPASLVLPPAPESKHIHIGRSY
jgi:hypothetical protein